MIQRFPEGAVGRCAAVVHGGLVYAVATDPVVAPDIATQTRNALEELDRLLLKTGSGKDKLIQATVYLSDIRDKPAMDAVWIPWIGDEQNWPQRACVGVQLVPGDLIEIVVTAALLDAAR